MVEQETLAAKLAKGLKVLPPTETTTSNPITTFLSGNFRAPRRKSLMALGGAGLALSVMYSIPIATDVLRREIDKIEAQSAHSQVFDFNLTPILDLDVDWKPESASPWVKAEISLPTASGNILWAKRLITDEHNPLRPMPNRQALNTDSKLTNLGNFAVSSKPDLFLFGSLNISKDSSAINRGFFLTNNQPVGPLLEKLIFEMTETGIYAFPLNDGDLAAAPRRRVIYMYSDQDIKNGYVPFGIIRDQIGNLVFIHPNGKNSVVLDAPNSLVINEMLGLGVYANDSHNTLNRLLFLTPK